MASSITIANVHAALIGLSNNTRPDTTDEAKQNNDRRKEILAGLNASRFWKG